MRVLTNMAFWQCPYWTERTDCIYEVRNISDDPAMFPPWREAWELFRRSPSYDVILTMESRTSLLYGLLCALAGRPSKQVLTEVFIDEPRPNNPLWRFKTALYRLVARRALGVITVSRGELRTVAERFDIPAERLRFVPLQCTLMDPHDAGISEGYVFSAGRSLRDYPTLLAAAHEIPAPIRIFCGRGDVIPEPLPSNVTVERDVPRARYLDALARCSVVALPLKNVLRPTGQVVMLEAMGLGKPVVATRQTGTVDYLRHGETGLLVEPQDPKALAAAVRHLLEHPEEARRMGRAALEDVRRYFSMRAHAEARLQALRELWELSRGETSKPLATT